MVDIRDPRFGGNMERANVGKQYSRAFPGGPPGVDQRYENYQAPHRVDYTSPRQTDTPRGRVELPSAPRQHPNPRMRGMMGGLGGLQEKSQLRRPEDFTNLDMLGRPDLSFRYSHMDPSQNAPIRGTYGRTQTGRTVADRDPRANEMDEYGYLKGAPRQRTTFTEGYMDPADFNEMYGGVYDDAIFRTVDPNTNRIEQYPPAGEGDTFNSLVGGMDGPQQGSGIENAGLWQTWKKILERTGNEELANQWLAGQQMATYTPGGSYDDDDYGPFVPPSVIEMDLEGIEYDPADEYDYDRKRGYPGYKWGSPPSYAARGGLMSLRR